MSIDSSDLTGQPPTKEDVVEAFAVVRKYRVNIKFMMANPELAVQLSNIERCLLVAASALSGKTGT